MTCEEFLPWLESDDPAKVGQAHRHAESCAACRDAARILDEIRQELTKSEPLPERLKQAFLNPSELASITLPTKRDRNKSRIGPWLVTLAAGVLIAIVALFAGKGRENDVADQAPKLDVRRVSSIIVRTVDPSAEFEGLEDDLNELKSQLALTKADLQRLAAVERLDHVLDDYGNLFAANAP